MKSRAGIQATGNSVGMGTNCLVPRKTKSNDRYIFELKYKWYSELRSAITFLFRGGKEMYGREGWRVREGGAAGTQDAR